MSADKLAEAVRIAISPGRSDADQALTWIRKAINTYRRDKQRRRVPSITYQRAQLKKAIRYAEKLSGCLEGLGFEANGYFALTKDEPWPHQYRESIDKLKAQAERAYKQMAGAHKSAPKDPAFRDLLAIIYFVWSRSFPGKSGVTRGTRGSDIHKYGGKLLDFARAVLEIEGIKHTHTGLGKRLYFLDVPWNPRARVPNTD